MRKFISFCFAFCGLAFFCGVPFLLLTGCGGSGQNNSNPATAVGGADPGWIALSGGDSIKGWHTYGHSFVGGAWRSDSGSIHLQPGAKNGYQTAGGGDLVTNDSFGDFRLQLEWKIGKKANSGILFYIREDTSLYKETWNTGMEMQICDKDSNEDAHSFKHEAGDLYDLVPSTVMSARGPGEWNQVEITSEKGKLSLMLNGVNIINTPLWDTHWRQMIDSSKFRDMPGFGTFHTGKIALQDHGEDVWFRNIRIRKL